ncbi:hypothetical protein BJ742DRAFT_215377 [Cladochytrium replicatum]|nr:hypothetical protein BJ742DRAFT_215377 [Cladochytrium replicatum]
MEIDLLLLLQVQALVAFAAAVNYSASYNVPLFLFGLVAHSQKDSNDLLRQFTTLTAFSIPLDIIFFIASPGSAWMVILSVVNFLLKFLTILRCVQSLRSIEISWPGASSHPVASPESNERKPSTAAGAYQQLG